MAFDPTMFNSSKLHLNIVEGWFVASLMYFYAQTFRGSLCSQKADKHQQVGQPLIQNIPKQ